MRFLPIIRPCNGDEAMLPYSKQRADTRGTTWHYSYTESAQFKPQWPDWFNRKLCLSWGHDLLTSNQHHCLTASTGHTNNPSSIRNLEQGHGIRMNLCECEIADESTVSSSWRPPEFGHNVKRAR